jgi:haloalkane dehalogenase
MNRVERGRVMISAEERYRKRYVEVRGLEMAYVEAGGGDPIVLLHGNPSSSYEWRNVIPYLTGLGRCIAPDLIGMGDSAKLPNSGPGSYRLVEHRAYLNALLEALGVRDRVTLVLHDWGSALGFDWAYRHQFSVRGIAYMEAFVAPIDSWIDWPEDAVALFQALRSPAGETMVLEDNFFIEKVLPGGTLRGLSEAEMAVYRRPYLEPGEPRRPTLTWPRQIPVAGEPRDVHDIICHYGEWLAGSDVPKLFVEAGSPGRGASSGGRVGTGRSSRRGRPVPRRARSAGPGGGGG